MTLTSKARPTPPDEEVISVGEEIDINLIASEEYTVRPGDTLSEIARDFGVDWYSLP